MYIFVLLTFLFTGKQVACRLIDSYLVSVESASEMESLASFLNKVAGTCTRCFWENFFTKNRFNGDFIEYYINITNTTNVYCFIQEASGFL